MEKTDLEKGRSILRSIKAQRLWCMKHQKGYIETEWARKELNNLEAALSTIKTSAQMRRYLERKQASILDLMPARNTRQREKFRALLEN
jgi:hypothetical protein